MFVKILKDELVDLLGGDASPLVTDKKPTITMIVGLQGGGKTTTIGKIGNMVRKKYHKNLCLLHVMFIDQQLLIN